MDLIARKLTKSSQNLAKDDWHFSPKNPTRLFSPLLTDFNDPGHELVLLTGGTAWNHFQSEFERLYSQTGQPMMSIRLNGGPRATQTFLWLWR